MGNSMQNVYMRTKHNTNIIEREKNDDDEEEEAFFACFAVTCLLYLLGFKPNQTKQVRPQANKIFKSMEWKFVVMRMEKGSKCVCIMYVYDVRWRIYKRYKKEIVLQCCRYTYICWRV